jgi:hypothetical protein
MDDLERCNEVADGIRASLKAEDALESCTLARRTALRERDEARQQLRGAVEAAHAVLDAAQPCAVGNQHVPSGLLVALARATNYAGGR